MKRVLAILVSLLLLLATLGAWARYRRLVQDGEVLVDDLERLASERWERPSHRPLADLVDVNACLASVLVRSPGRQKLLAASTKPNPSLEPELGPFLAQLARCSRGTVLAPTEGVSQLRTDKPHSTAIQATAAWNMHTRTLVAQGDVVGALDFCADAAGTARDSALNASATSAAHLLEGVAPDCAAALPLAPPEARARFAAELEHIRAHPAPACAMARLYEASVRVWSIGGWLPVEQRARFPSGLRRVEEYWSGRRVLEPLRYATRRASLAGTMRFCSERWPTEADLLAMQSDWDDTLIGGPVQAGFLVENVVDQQRILDALSFAARRLDDPSAAMPSGLRAFDENGHLLVETRLSNRKFTLELPR